MTKNSIIKLKIEDSIFASKVCQNAKIKSNQIDPPPQQVTSVSARSVFVDLYSDIAMNIAQGFAREYNYSEPIYLTIKGSTFSITDEIMDAYLWLLNEGFKKCCLYKGKNGAPLVHYLNSVLRSKFTKIDYIRYKTGVNTNIPKCILVLGDLNKKMFLLLRQKKSRNYICAKLELNITDYTIYKNQILETLYSDGKEDLLFDSIQNEYSDETYSDKNLDINEIQIINRFIESIIPSILHNLPKASIRFMIEYWGRQQSVKSIFNIWKNCVFANYLVELGISQPRDFYILIENIAKSVKENIKNSFPMEFNDYPNIDIKLLLNEYFRNWVIEQELNYENDK